MLAGWALTRATFYARGVHLPPLGSAQDNVIQSIYKRELSDKLAQTSLFARLIGKGLGIEPNFVEDQIESYHLEITGERYSPEFLKKLKNAAKKEKKKKKSEKALLDRVAKMSGPTTDKVVLLKK